MNTRRRTTAFCLLIARHPSLFLLKRAPWSLRCNGFSDVMVHTWGNFEVGACPFRSSLEFEKGKPQLLTYTTSVGITWQWWWCPSSSSSSCYHGDSNQNSLNTWEQGISHVMLFLENSRWWLRWIWFHRTILTNHAHYRSRLPTGLIFLQCS